MNPTPPNRQPKPSPQPRKVVTGGSHHSDRGRQYASADYRAALAAAGLVASMSRAGNPYDTAAMESFFSTLKIECLHRQELTTGAALQAVTFDYLEVFYNRERIHSRVDSRLNVTGSWRPSGLR